MRKYTDFALDARGNAIAGAEVRVYSYPSGAAAVVYQENGSDVQPQPILTTELGRFEFYAGDGRYSVAINVNEIVTTVEDILFEDPLDPSVVNRSGGVDNNIDMQSGVIRAGVVVEPLEQHKHDPNAHPELTGNIGELVQEAKDARDEAVQAAGQAAGSDASAGASAISANQSAISAADSLAATEEIAEELTVLVQEVLDAVWRYDAAATAPGDVEVDAILIRTPLPRPALLRAGIEESQLACMELGATGSVVVAIYRNDIEVGTISIDSAGLVVRSFMYDVNFVVGDTLGAVVKSAAAGFAVLGICLRMEI